jgi:rubrerythrin
MVETCQCSISADVNSKIRSRKRIWLLGSKNHDNRRTIMANDDVYLCPRCGFVVNEGDCPQCHGQGNSRAAEAIQKRMNRSEKKLNGKGYMPPDSDDSD